MRIYFILLFILIFSKSGVFAQEKFPIVAWGSVPETYTNDDQYQLLKEAGINVSYSYFRSLSSAITAMDIAAKYNVKILLYCPELFSNTEETIRKVKNHPGLAGYFLDDEPNISRFDKIKDWVNRIQEYDKEHICYVNLFPITASFKQLGGISYQNYLNRFYSKFNLKVYSFDYYPITNGQLKGSWFQNLEMIRGKSMKKGASFWGFVKVMSLSNRSETFREADLKLQAFTNLAYGAQGIQFYRYWSLDTKRNDGPISVVGRKNINYNKVKKLSGYIQSLQSVFLNCSVENIFHTEVIKGTKRFSPQDFPELILSNMRNLLISKIRNGKDRYIVFVNKNLNSETRFQVTPKLEMEVLDKDLKSRMYRKGMNYEIKIEPGDILILRY